MRVQLGAAGAWRGPTGIGVKVIPREDKAQPPQTPEERGVSLGRGDLPFLPCQPGLPAARAPTAFPEICTRIWGSEPSAVGSLETLTTMGDPPRRRDIPGGVPTLL